jgi:putative ubiquitin-RnfH superfamily antitoxin RatB of RatAB toxin-antitoxin module
MTALNKSMFNILVAYANTERQVEIPLTVEASCTVALAIQRSGLLRQFPEIQWGCVVVGIYSQRVALDALLHEGDRVEIYRPLRMDPKQARLTRAKLKSG